MDETAVGVTILTCALTENIKMYLSSRYTRYSTSRHVGQCGLPSLEGQMVTKGGDDL